MSIQFNPKSTQSAAGCNQQPQLPKPGVLQWWADSMYKGAKMETMPCAKYCKWQWDIRDPDTWGYSRKSFFNKCMADCASFKDFAKGSRIL